MDDNSVSENGVESIARSAQIASRGLRNANRAVKDELLVNIAAELEASAPSIISANKVDVERERALGMPAGLIDRLTLNEDRIGQISSAVRFVAQLPDPIGEVVRGSTLANGLTMRQVRVPMGVIGMIYEARPNVTVDATVLALKAGSAVILRGGSAACETNREIVAILRKVVECSGYDPNLINTIDQYGRAGSVALMRARGLVDLVIPRGGAGLIRTVVEQSTVPVIETGTGNCHVYVDSSADLRKAEAIVLNSKTHRIGVCNAAESLVVHRDVAPQFFAHALVALSKKGVRIHGCPETQKLAPAGVVVLEANEEDWGREYLDLDIAVKTVASEEEAIEHIRTYSTGHTEAIVAQNVEAIHAFTAGIDSAAIMINASTRFTDGGELGLGAEIGISTQKLHARGPMGLAELTTTTWIVEGDGHVRN